MINLLVCDDSDDVLDTVSNYAEQITAFDIKCIIFNNSKDVIEYVDDNGSLIDAYILDIGIDGMSGLELARYIRSRDDNAAIILISSNDKYMRLGYEVMPLRFLLKPLEFSRFDEAMKVTYEYLNRHNNKFTFVTNGKVITAPFKDIYALESSNKVIKVYMDEVYETRMPLKKAYELLNPLMFGSISNYAVVNMEKISSIEKSQIKLENGLAIALSKRGKKDILEQYKEFIEYIRGK